MFDAIPVLTFAAAAIVGWVLCFTNRRVFFLWKLIAPVAILFLAAYLIGQVFTDAFRMVVWSGIKMDWLTIGLACAPVLAWPIRSKKTMTPARAVAGMG